MVRFANVADQLAARDAVNDELRRHTTSPRCPSPRARPKSLRALGLRPMPLGLDLRGGLYLLYQVDVNGAVAQLLESYDQDARRALASANIPFTRRRPRVAVESDAPERACASRCRPAPT